MLLTHVGRCAALWVLGLLNTKWQSPKSSLGLPWKLSASPSSHLFSLWKLVIMHESVLVTYKWHLPAVYILVLINAKCQIHKL